jgi:3-phytase
MKRIFIPGLILIAGLIFLFVRKTKNSTDNDVGRIDTMFVNVHAILETDQVPCDSITDSADDPAVWYNEYDPASSLIFGTDKKGGIMVLNLDGKLIRYHRVGLPNNIDIRKGFRIGDRKADIAGFSNRENNTIEIFEIHPDGNLTNLLQGEAKPLFTGEVYGFCFYQNRNTSEFYAVINSKEGEIEVWHLNGSSGNVDLTHVKSFKTASQPEGMVADDIHEILYAGEEDTGIWRFDLKTGNPEEPRLLAEGSVSSNIALKDDIEGLAICFGEEGSYLIASSQGNNSYAVFNLDGENKYIGSFRITDDKTDGTEDTDGIDLLNVTLNNSFPEGIFIAQDGMNLGISNTLECQNFKFVSWRDILAALKRKNS